MLWLDSDVGADDIVAVCCFLINESQISIGRGHAPAHAGEEPPTTAAQAAEHAQHTLQPPAAIQTQHASASAPAQQPEADAPAAEPPALPQRPAAGVSAPAASAASAPASEAEKKACPQAAASAEGSLIRVGVEKMDQLINLVSGGRTRHHAGHARGNHQRLRSGAARPPVQRHGATRTQRARLARKP